MGLDQETAAQRKFTGFNVLLFVLLLFVFGRVCRPVCDFMTCTAACLGPATLIKELLNLSGVLFSWFLLFTALNFFFMIKIILDIFI